MDGRPTTMTVLLLAALAAVGGVLSPPAFGQCDNNYYWDDGYGSWFAPGNWYHEVWDPNLQQCVDDDTIPGAGGAAVVWSGNPYIGTAGATCYYLELNSHLDVLPGGSLSCSHQRVGLGGTGILVQTGGTNSVTEDVSLGHLYTGSSGTYALSATGELYAGRLMVGWVGSGMFSQTGGAVTLMGGHDDIAFEIGVETGSDGRYELNEGTLTANGFFVVGHSGTGTFIQSGGTNTVAGDLSVGHGDPGGVGSYELSDSATLVAGRVIVGWEGTGTFLQTGGTNTVGQDPDGTSLVIGAYAGSNGRYELSGGAELYAATEAIGQLGTGTFIQTGGTNTITGQGGVALFLGNELGASGRYELSGDAALYADNERVGCAGTGTFIQTGGTNTTTGALGIGTEAGGTGTYELGPGGELTAKWLDVAWAGTGTFIHTGGVSTIMDGPEDGGLTIACEPGSSGRYELHNGAQLYIRATSIARLGTGVFVQSGGTCTVTGVQAGHVAIAVEPGSDGRYELGGDGQLSTPVLTVGEGGTGTFIQTGGTHRVEGEGHGWLSVGVNAGSVGRYELGGDGELYTTGSSIGDSGEGTFILSDGATFQTSYENIGDTDGTGFFIHTGGTHEVTGGSGDGGLVLGFQADSEGRYELAASGQLYAYAEAIGWSGTGTFIQSGGTHSVMGVGHGWLSLGVQPGSVGQYELSGDGELYTRGMNLGEAGTGTFIQSGGTNTVETGLVIGSAPNSEGTYGLSGGSLLVMDDVWVGQEGTGSLLIDGPLATLDTPHLLIGCGSGTGSFSIANAAAEIIIGDLTFGANATFSAVPGSSIHVDAARIQNYSTDENALAGLESLNLICDGHYLTLEVAGYDGGPFTEYCTDNFVIDTLTVNDVVSLWDDVDNGNRGGTYGWNEALYVNNLVFGPDGMLYTYGLHVYVNCEPLSGDHGGHVCYGSGCGDFDHDCDADSADFFDFVSCLSGPYVPIGPECNPGDCDADGDVDLIDFAAFQVAFTGP